jgi:uncharacterized protein DUF2125
MGRRKFAAITAIAATAGAVTIAVALAAYWLWAAGQVRTAIAQWAEAQRAAGYDIAYAGPEIGGFPIRLAVRLDAPRIAAPEGWRWSGGAIAGEAAFWQPLLLRLALPLEQELAGVWRGTERTLRMQAARADATIRFDARGQAVAATLEATDISVQDAGGGRLRIARLRHRANRPPPMTDGVSHLLLRGEIEALTLAETPPAPFPATIDRLAYDADLIGTIPPGEPAAALAAWRDGGGALNVVDLVFVWGPLDVRADGTLTLDTLLRPHGTFSARIAGLPEMLDAAVAQGMVQPGAAAGLRLAVLTLADGRDASGRPVVRLPVTLRDGRVFLGPVPLARLDPVL